MEKKKKLTHMEITGILAQEKQKQVMPALLPSLGQGKLQSSSLLGFWALSQGERAALHCNHCKFDGMCFQLH